MSSYTDNYIQLYTGLGVQLPRLRQVGGGLAEQVDLEQVGRALGRGGGEEGRIEAHEAALREEVLDAALELVPDAHDRPRRAVAQVQVAMLAQEVDAVLLGRDGVSLARPRSTASTS